MPLSWDFSACTDAQEIAYAQEMDRATSLEFSNDGVRDSLTLSMAPEIFHANLKREIANAQRENRDLVVLSIGLIPERFDSVAQAQESLIALAHQLEHGLRSGDFYSRIFDWGFWILLRTSELEAVRIYERFELSDREDVTAHIVARKKDEYDEWIKKLDLITFSGNEV